MDGAGQSLPGHRRAGEFQFHNDGHDTPFYLRANHRRGLRRLVSARCARFRVEYGMGRGLRIVVVVFGPVDDSAALARPLARSYERGATLFGSLVGHIIYGLIVGLVYAALDKLWVGFFR